MAENKDIYTVLLEGGQGEIEEKKSRFIANIKPVSTEEEAALFIAEMKKKYWDARHNCSAFIIGRNNELSRCSDDGEPSGTAGRPMLEVLTGSSIHNICVVVTRYFGGTLLGTGGLVRAYSQAVKEGLKNCVTGKIVTGYEFEITADYSDISKVLFALEKADITPENSVYADNVKLTVKVAEGACESLMKNITEATGARVKFSEKKLCSFIDKDVSQT
ncbi:MAG: YigZ family protein [Lachnospiraceae bacterium]|nr:YigZ family protein [Lachnospiraceae bacterium]